MKVQTMVVRKTGMVVISDLVDDVNGIHPSNKQDVGKRLPSLKPVETISPGLK
jgi:sialate O-acetylesterase